MIQSEDDMNMLHHHYRKLYLIFLSALIAPFCLIGCGIGSARYLTLMELHEQPPERLQVTTNDGRVYELDVFALANDEIFGTGYEVLLQGKQPFTGRIPISEIQRLYDAGTSSQSSGVTILLWILGIAGALGALFLILLISLEWH